MDTSTRIINEIKARNNLQGRANIGSLANSYGLSEEDIKILTFSNEAMVEKSAHKDEIVFDKNVFKKPSIYETLG